MIAHRPNQHVRAAFTLVEVLVVVVIISILIAFAVPSYQNLIESSERSLAVNTLRNAVTAAQDIALSGTEGEDGAVVFLHDGRGRISIVPAVKVGTYDNPIGVIGGGGLNLTPSGVDSVSVDVFVPIGSGEYAQLPEYWSVRGFAPAGSLLDPVQVANIANERTAARWYNSPAYGGDNIFSDIKNRDHWVFPETGFYAIDAQYEGGPDDGTLGASPQNIRTPRQSFMIRFDSQTGQLKRDSSAAIFIDPRPSRERPYGDQPDPDRERWLRVDLDDSVKRWALRLLEHPNPNDGDGPYQRQDHVIRAQLLGNASHDTVLVKPVTRVALYDERVMAADLGARGLNATGTIYEDYDQTNPGDEIRFDQALWESYPGDEDLILAINRWVEGDTNNDGRIDFDTEDAVGRVDLPQARLYIIEPYGADLVEVFR